MAIKFTRHENNLDIQSLSLFLARNTELYCEIYFATLDQIHHVFIHSTYTVLASININFHTMARAKLYLRQHTLFPVSC
jgi:hypothetical protein